MFAEAYRQALAKNVSGEDAVNQMINAMVREGLDPALSIDDQFFRQYGIRAQTPLLHLKPREDGRSVRLKKHDTIEILHRCDLLEDILKGVERAWTGEVRDGLNYYQSQGQPVSKQRACRMGDNAVYYWIDTVKEIP